MAARNEASQKMEDVLRRGGVAVKEVDVFGSHVIVTTRSRGAAERAGRLLERASWTVDRVGEALDYAKKNLGTNLNPTTVKVWRVWAHA